MWAEHRRTFPLLFFATGTLLLWMMATTGDQAFMLTCLAYMAMLIFSAVSHSMFGIPEERLMEVGPESFYGCLAGLGMGLVAWASRAPYFAMRGPIQAVLLTVVVPVVEEVFFRGTLMPFVRLQSGSAAVAYVLSSVAFSAFHLLVWSVNPAWAVAYFAFGVLACWLTDRYGLGSAILMHFTANMACFLA